MFSVMKKMEEILVRNSVTIDLSLEETKSYMKAYPNANPFRAGKVDSVGHNAALKLIYGWVKQGTIGLKEFAELLKVSKHSLN